MPPIYLLECIRQLGIQPQWNEIALPNGAPPLTQNTTTYRQSGDQATVVDSEMLEVLFASQANSIGT